MPEVPPGFNDIPYAPLQLLCLREAAVLPAVPESLCDGLVQHLLELGVIHVRNGGGPPPVLGGGAGGRGGSWEQRGLVVGFGDGGRGGGAVDLRVLGMGRERGGTPRRDALARIPREEGRPLLVLLNLASGKERGLGGGGLGGLGGRGRGGVGWGVIGGPGGDVDLEGAGLGGAEGDLRDGGLEG